MNKMCLNLKRSPPASRVSRLKPATQLTKEVREDANKKYVDHHLTPFMYSSITDKWEGPNAADELAGAFAEWCFSSAPHLRQPSCTKSLVEYLLLENTIAPAPFWLHRSPPFLQEVGNAHPFELWKNAPCYGDSPCQGDTMCLRADPARSGNSRQG